MYNSLAEVITLTKDLLADAAAAGAAAAGDAGGSGAGPSGAGGGDAAAAAAAAGDAGASGSGSGDAAAAAAAAGELGAPGALPDRISDQIRRAQQRAALAGTAPAGWAAGADCLAYYAADGQWYPARVDSVTEGGAFVVTFEGYGNTEELAPGAVRPRPGDEPEQQQLQEGYRGVAAPKRRRVEEQPAAVAAEMPKWLEIKPGDDERTIEKKRKLIKAHKSKIRFQTMDLETKSKQSNWQSFLKGKGAKAKAGFMTGKKKGSMFSVPDGGKVGVVGSGRPMTEAKKAARHEFAVE